MKTFFLFFGLLFGLVYSYQIGAGIYDMTGPAVEINFMGYAVPSQRGSGIHLRLRGWSIFRTLISLFLDIPLVFVK